MPTAAEYRPIRTGFWFFWVLKGEADDGLLDSLAAIAEGQPYSKHPQTLRFSRPSAGSTSQFFMKVFHQRRGAAKLKDLLRQTKARRFWRQGMALCAAGFNVPHTVAFGEKRRRGLPERSLVLTSKIEGQPVPLYLSALNGSVESRRQIKHKRIALFQLGQLVRRFHDLGFVHGDLVATNILVADPGADAPSFYFMDNDRTQKYPAWLTGHLRNRNLVQLNRMPLAHITLQDRMRFLRSYLRVDSFGKAQRDFALWLEVKTRQRRWEVDGADASVSFRTLMAWHDPTVSRPRS